MGRWPVWAWLLPLAGSHDHSITPLATLRATFGSPEGVRVLEEGAVRRGEARVLLELDGDEWAAGIELAGPSAALLGAIRSVASEASGWNAIVSPQLNASMLQLAVRLQCRAPLPPATAAPPDAPHALARARRRRASCS